MRILRILLDAPLDPSRAFGWALFDGNGRWLGSGRDPPSGWPAADRREAVVDAESARIVVLALPPLPRERLVAAATFALEDRIATSPDDAALVVGERDASGRVATIVLPREVADTLVNAVPPFARAIAEAELVGTPDGWHWCESERTAFVRTHEGEAFAVSHATGDGLPPELALALGQARREGRAPRSVVADREATPALLDGWQAQTGIAFVAGDPWRWENAPAPAFDAATDLLTSLARRREPPARSARMPFALSAAVAATAIVLHVVAGLGTWAWQRFSLAQLRGTQVDIAQRAGAKDVTPENAAAALARVHAQARHRASLPAPVDAMPLLARAAPALAALPPNALKTAGWSGGAWTLELGPLDDAATLAFIQRLNAAGVTALHARTAAGVRARIAPAP
jgi:hypothetical protein